MNTSQFKIFKKLVCTDTYRVVHRSKDPLRQNRHPYHPFQFDPPKRKSFLTFRQSFLQSRRPITGTKYAQGEEREKLLSLLLKNDWGLVITYHLYFSIFIIYYLVLSYIFHISRKYIKQIHFCLMMQSSYINYAYMGTKSACTDLMDGNRRLAL